ncbi:hypothetical protein O7606_15880 [Micromonospora sp. WMMD882]|uniref:hypothetical protein n=1 Tax=Micromonospora sp. WMMD882 TaxID=3015151 RepID=UPI00248C7C8E|nr:hypothetical protein [Micromonospora sp. WMMD882]WBB77749.1 hypothetical protein O7606_15880 [Micromonospora sp. WMMD882]
MSEDRPAPSRGERIQRAEQEAAKRRILELAAAERGPAEDVSRVVRVDRWRRERG